jgi:hypothetical protein
MEFREITSVVNDAWQFMWPPATMMLIALGVSNFLHRANTVEWLQRFVEGVKSSGARIEEIRTALDGYGLSKLVPLASAIAVIAFLFLLNGPVMQAASTLPPTLVFTSAKFAQQHSTERQKLLLLRKYPAAESFEDAYSLAQDELLSSASTSEKRHDRLGKHYQIQGFIKFAFVCAVVFFILHKIRGGRLLPLLSRFIALCAFIAVIWVVSFPFLLFNHEQTLFDDWRTMEIALQKDATTLLAAEPSERERRILDNASPDVAKTRWWEVRVFDAYMFHWIERNIVNG